MSESSADNTRYILPAMLIVGGIVFFNKLMEALGLSKDKDETAVDENRDKTLAEALAAAEKIAPSTKTAAEWVVIADQIYADLKHSSIDDDKDDAGYQLARVKNDTDVYKLIMAFGTRTEYGFGLPIGKGPLSYFVVGNLSDTAINVVNDNYRRKGIKFQW